MNLVSTLALAYASNLNKAALTEITDHLFLAADNLRKRNEIHDALIYQTAAESLRAIAEKAG